jgi:hypothetical protein
VAPYVAWLAELKHSGATVAALSPGQREQSIRECMLTIGDFIESSDMNSMAMWRFVNTFTRDNAAEGQLARTYSDIKAQQGRRTGRQEAGRQRSKHSPLLPGLRVCSVALYVHSVPSDQKAKRCEVVLCR